MVSVPILPTPTTPAVCVTEIYARDVEFLSGRRSECLFRGLHTDPQISNSQIVINTFYHKVKKPPYHSPAPCLYSVPAPSTPNSPNSPTEPDQPTPRSSGLTLHEVCLSLPRHLFTLFQQLAIFRCFCIITSWQLFVIRVSHTTAYPNTPSPWPLPTLRYSPRLSSSRTWHWPFQQAMKFVLSRRATTPRAS